MALLEPILNQLLQATVHSRSTRTAQMRIRRITLTTTHSSPWRIRSSASSCRTAASTVRVTGLPQQHPPGVPQEFFEDLNPREKELCSDFVFECGQVYLSKIEAEDFAEDAGYYSGVPGPHHGPQDALRHAMFYTRATDRVSTKPYGALSWTLDNLTYLGGIFDQGGNVWSGLTQLIADELGSGAVRDSVIYRPDYDQIQDVLNGDAPVSSLEGCQ